MGCLTLDLVLVELTIDTGSRLSVVFGQSFCSEPSRKAPVKLWSNSSPSKATSQYSHDVSQFLHLSRVGIGTSFAASDWSVATIPALSLVETINPQTTLHQSFLERFGKERLTNNYTRTGTSINRQLH